MRRHLLLSPFNLLKSARDVNLQPPVSTAEQLVHYLENSPVPIAPVLFVLFTINTVCCLPAAWLTFACGALLGIGQGTLVANLVAVSSAAITRLLGRSSVGTHVQAWLDRRSQLRLLRETLNDGGWKLNFLVRLSPALPLGISNWVFAFVDLPLTTYLIITSIATLPAQLVWVNFGVTGRQSLNFWQHPEEVSSGQWMVFALSLSATIASIVVIGGLTRRKLRAELAQRQ